MTGCLASGVTAPLRSLTVPGGTRDSIALDLVHDELLITNDSGTGTDASLTAYARTASGNTPPLRTLTGLDTPRGVILDLVHDEVVVTSTRSISVYARTASGNASPLRTLALPGFVGQVALDLVHDELVVPSFGPSFKSVLVYARTASGGELPLRSLTGAATGFFQPTGVALDLVHDELIVVDQIAGGYGSVRVYARTASGNTAPLRTFFQPQVVSFANPVGVALDLVHDELVVANFGAGFGGSVAVHTRTASGNAIPLRTLFGERAPPSSISAQSVTLSTSPPLMAGVLPLSRSHQAATLLTAFATIINAGPGPVQQCLVQPPASPPAGLGPFIFQTTDRATNLPTGTANTPAQIAAGGLQAFVFGFMPTGAIPETSLMMSFLCDNTVAAIPVAGVNNLLVVTDTTPVPDTIALMATLGGDGVVRIPDSAGLQFFAIGTANVGATGTVTVSADTGGLALPVRLTMCETDSATGVCLGSPTPTVTVAYEGASTRSFAFFAQASGSIPFDPAVNRVFARLTDAGGVTRGATSAALCTTPNPGC